MSFFSRQQKKEQGFFLNILKGKKNKERAGPYPKESPRKTRSRVSTPVTDPTQIVEAGTSETEVGTSALSNVPEIHGETTHEETGSLHGNESASSSTKKRSREEEDGIFN